jgi:hypothetical protein
MIIIAEHDLSRRLIEHHGQPLMIVQGEITIMPPVIVFYSEIGGST